MDGWERISHAELREITILHVLMFEPNVPVAGNGGGFQNDCLRTAVTFSWRPGNIGTTAPEKTLVLNFDGGPDTVEINKRTYDARSGNLFVVHLNEQWVARVEQVSTSIVNQNTSPADVLLAFKRALPMDSDVQAAVLRKN